MPRAIADSDDDEDILEIERHECDAEAALPKDNVTRKANVAATSLDNTYEQSTGSTERLRRQIHSAERRLVSNFAPEAMDGYAAISSASPSVRANRRMHSAVFGSETGASSDRNFKRSKTTKVYGSKRSTSVTDDSSFERLRKEQAVPKTSQSTNFTEHSGFDFSAALPSGSIQDDFMSHQPNVMFRDSGSTIADNSSAQQRMLDEALGFKPGVNMDEQQDRSVPWSTEEGNDSTEGSDKKGSPLIQTAYENHTEVNATTEDAGSFPNTSSEDHQSADNGTSRMAGEEIPNHPEAHLHSNITLSPAVEIPRDEIHNFMVGPETSQSTEGARNGRKRKAPENQDTDLLILDDRPVGLPTEEYRPRPSKRRATQIVEEPIDYSVRPDKAVKIKRTKTTHPGGSSVTVKANPGDPAKRASVAMSSIKAATYMREDGVGSDAETPRTESFPTQVPQVITEDTDTGNEKMERKTSQEDSVAPASLEQEFEDDIITKPPKVTQSRKSMSRNKRSHTTIFEDHVEFASAQQLPKLSQQQANRKSALQPVQNEAKTSRGKSKIVVTDDEDEDELVGELNEEQIDDLAPKKRGRGRPPKSTAKVELEPADKALTEDRDMDENQPKLEEAPKRRGRPSKAREVSEVVTKTDRERNEPSNSQLQGETPRKQIADVETNDFGNASDRSATYLASAKLLTPSPEKQHTPQKIEKSSPTTHSPLKSSSTVPLRVGLSKSQRIQPLLRMVKPPKR